MELRAVTRDELPELIRVDWAAFGGQPNERMIEVFTEDLDPARAFAVFDDHRMVASSGAYSQELTVPGGAQVPVGGLTFIGVLPTHRRRGLLRQLIERHLADCRERGEALSGLTASEATIYGRFGYGVATLDVHAEIERRHTQFHTPVSGDGTFTLVDRDTALTAMPAVHDRIRARRHGEVSRAPARWRADLAELDERVSGDLGWFHLLHADRNGEVDGYALYRVADDEWEAGLSRARLEVREVAADDETTRTALWRFVFDLDLVERITAQHLAPDDPLWWQLADPRRLRTTKLTDHLWVRLLDIPRAFSARTYGGDGSLVLAVTGDADVAGCYRLDVEEGRGACVPTQDQPDLALDVAALGSLYLGGVAPTTLQRAGRLDEHRAGCVALADRLLLTPTQPYCTSVF